MLPVALGALMLAATPSAAVPSGWTRPSRAHATHATVAHDLAVEADGTIHLAVEGARDGGIWYISGGPGAWSRQQVSSGDDRSPSIALDGSGVVIAFARMDPADRGMFTVTNIDGDWAAPVRRHDGAASAPSLAIHEGRAHIAFREGASSLRYAAGPDDALDGTGWISELVDGSCCTSAPSLAVTSTGDARIAHADGTAASPGGLVVQSRSGPDSWSRQVIVASRVSAPALAVYGTGLYLAYVKRGAGTWYASRPAGQRWTLKQLDAAASGPPDISAFSGSAAFVFGKPGRLRYATMSGGILLTRAFSSTSGDRTPHITRVGGRPVVTWLRVNGGRGDGLLVSRQR